MKIGLISLVQADKHSSPLGHPENAERVEYAISRLRESDLSSELIEFVPEPADMEVIFKVHSREYLEHLRIAADSGVIYLDGDTYMTKTSCAAARETASAAIAAVDAIVSGKFCRIFLAGRPPGHHAERNRGMGFCLLNNSAIAAEQACTIHNMNRVAIIDWDVHHGNGTQQIFYDRSDVFYVSLHRFPFYPGTGTTAEQGEGEGLGYTFNMPFRQGTGDDAYLSVFDEFIIPAMNEFKPEFIIITAGFDAHREDPLGGMNLTERCFGAMTARLVNVANKYCQGRILSLFEGGYSPVGNALSLYQHAKELLKD
jgi:acetoin utilization deacetylase AcuC-like enzyme